LPAIHGDDSQSLKRRHTIKKVPSTLQADRLADPWVPRVSGALMLYIFITIYRTEKCNV